MSTDAPRAKKLVSDYIERVWNQGQLDAVDELVAPDYVAHDANDAVPVRGRDGLKAAITSYRSAFPDLVNTIEEQIAEGDLVATRWSSTGTHQGDSFGLEATGRRRDVTGVTIIRLADALVAEEWHSWDALGLLRQLGALPAGV
jgi:steroid delta-isomerase-like uncharacterized protein